MSSRLNCNWEVLVFKEGGKPAYPEKTPRSRDENQQQTQPTYDVNSENGTRTILVGAPHLKNAGSPNKLVVVYCASYPFSTKPIRLHLKKNKKTKTNKQQQMISCGENITNCREGINTIASIMNLFSFVNDRTLKRCVMT